MTARDDSHANAAVPQSGAESPNDASASSAELEATTPPMTIDEFAAATRVPSRTIRYYQAKALLPPPTLHGRVAYYGQPHHARLGLIAQLQDRGLKIDAIRELVRRIDRGELDVAEWLGVEDQLRTPWVADPPRTVTEAELLGMIGHVRPGLVADLVRLGAVERRGEVYLIPSPAMLAVITRLADAGVELDTSIAAEKILRKHMSRAVSELVSHFFTEIERGHIQSRADGPNLLEMLRPTGLEAVRNVFGQEIEKALRERVEAGKATPKRALASWRR